ncbi:MAG: hypothetical protein M0C28_16010 [Candidatus Moduliflexus flocculans]|nr:hypothetical protein [Candidatus Moduliflexus flocculans]
MTDAERTFTAAAVPAVERRCRETLAALLSRLSDAAGDTLAGAALGGALGRGEAPTTVDAAGAFVTGAPFELFVVLRTTPGRAATLVPHLARDLAATARPRHAAVRVADGVALGARAPAADARVDRVRRGGARRLGPTRPPRALLAPLAGAQPAPGERAPPRGPAGRGASRGRAVALAPWRRARRRPRRAGGDP